MNRIRVVLSSLAAAFIFALCWPAPPGALAQGQDIYVSNGINDTVRAIDLSSRNTVAKNAPPGPPRAEVLDGKYLYTADADTSVVAVIDTPTNSVVSSIP